MISTPRKIRCAIYTRKSSEEGLEQSFNSLNAQLDACEAYVLSQRHEGWLSLASKYDDGGFSGGNMDRPGLKKLLEDIAAGKIDTVVVYKVDRLTRALSDFAKMVETFDKYGVSLVSVTQQFNTTTSMGRLTLNVLLSFAQFEREITGERIRDKVASSKRKGMWMGGAVPLGYDWKNRQLLVNKAEAEKVREIFQQYLRLGSVFALHKYLVQTDIRGKRRTDPTGHQYGGAILSCGTLYHQLSNPLYMGKIAHNGMLYPGLHEPIVDEQTWEKTASRLKENRVNRHKSKNSPSGRMLMGLLFDQDGNRFTPTHASKKGRRYCYYISQLATAGKRSTSSQRLPAGELERVVISRLRELLTNQLELAGLFPSLTIREMRLLIAAALYREEQLADAPSLETIRIVRKLLCRVIIRDSEAQIELNRDVLRCELLGGAPMSRTYDDETEHIRLTCPFIIARRGQQVRIIISAGSFAQPRPVPSLLKAIAQSRDWADQIVSGKMRTVDDIVKYSGLTRQYIRRIIRCAALSPHSIDGTIHGDHPVDLTVVGLTSKIPLDWAEQ